MAFLVSWHISLQTTCELQSIIHGQLIYASKLSTLFIPLEPNAHSILKAFYLKQVGNTPNGKMTRFMTGNIPMLANFT